jgi:hypothetical protein
MAVSNQQLIDDQYSKKIEAQQQKLTGDYEVNKAGYEANCRRRCPGEAQIRAKDACCPLVRHV